MDKAVIVGVFEFLGFHFCQNLLNNGIEVDGLHMGSNYDDGFLLEEKRMEIGRNANFKEYAFRDYQWIQEKIQKIAVIVDYYDLFMRRKEADFFSLEPIKGLLSYLKTSKERAVFLLPIQFLSQSRFEKERIQIERFFGLLKKKGGSYQKFYLPTVYGPWQPEEFSFQKHFLRDNKSHKPFKVDEREWLADAIYVQETVETILHYYRQDKEEYLLTSGKKNQWANCANYLSITIEGTQGHLSDKSQKLTIPVRKNTPIETALAQQQHHTERLRTLY